eukprot:TRINITY_DN109417_c0_g1_i1.p1 TRINITY_DN109417_c0_g1~~TRINITY_DN109417_c0_g1_i1.p1  ORF type:complete len:410 (-),score=95.57 TRINITY_DN109417_c0_g1_i1:275-1426(-)
MSNLVPLSQAAWDADVDALGDQPGKQVCTERLSATTGPVCVTGANGFIALHVVKQLLEKGYTVFGTVRSMSNRAKMAPLLELQEKYGKDKLQFVLGVDCSKPESFGAAVQGCIGVFHLASPFHYNTQDPLRDLVVPAKVGTESCLKACKKAGCVKRVVVTSSAASVFNLGLYPWDHTYTSKDWNKASCPNADGAFPEPSAAHGYRFSKTIAEKAAWDFLASEECFFDVSTINPPMVVGENLNRPSSPEELNTSSSLLLQILLGQKAPAPHSMGWVDVEDVARAHIAAYENPEAGGRRFLCCPDEVPTWTQLAWWLKEANPSCPVNCEAPEGGPGLQMRLDSSGLKGLSGFGGFKSAQETVRGQAKSLLNLGFLSQAQCELGGA